MGVTASTLTATARFAEMAGTSVIPFILYRRDDGLGYEGIFMPPLENYPSDNAEQDAIRVNNIIEAAIRAHPEQYLWQYKRFKTRPPGEEKIYKKEMLK
jgi:KDO2-lipid IV(A) lauroyltransferase